MPKLSFDKLLPLVQRVMVKALYSNYIYNLRFSACHEILPGRAQVNRDNLEAKHR